MFYNRIIFAFIFLFFFSICTSSDNVNNENDLTLLLHENLVNKLLLNFDPIEKEGKKGIIHYKMKVSDFSFNFIDEKGKLTFDVRVSGKRGKKLFKKEIRADLSIGYNQEDNLIVLDIKELKVPIGKLGEIKLTKLFKETQFTILGPELSSFSVSKNNKKIAPSIKDADASFIKDAIKIAFTFDFK